MTRGTFVTMARWRGGMAAATAVLLVVAGLAGGGCGPGEKSVSGLYDPLPESGDPSATSGVPARAPRPPNPPGALLSVIATELSPATLWHSAAREVECFAGLPAWGLGGPVFLAYSSPTGIAIARPGDRVDGSLMRENWLLTGFAGAEGWDEWDSPWAVFLQNRPREARLTTNGVRITFPAEAGHFSLMPLYGYYKPPQRGREFLTGQGFKEKELLTWEWSTVVARDPLIRLRYWAGATRHFPFHCREEVSVDRASDALVLRQAFSFLDVPDAWGTKPLKLAPVSPPLGLALSEGGRAFDAMFSLKPLDFEMPTPFGPLFGIQNVDAYTVRFPWLGRVNTLPADHAVSAGDEAEAARERLRALGRDLFGSIGREGARVNALWDLVAAPAIVTALPHFDPLTRSNATTLLGRFFRDVVLTEQSFVTGEFPAGSGRAVAILKPVAADATERPEEALARGGRALQSLWAYAHAAEDHALVRERWPLIRKLLPRSMAARWAAFGGSAIDGEGVDPESAIAYARLAYLAGDGDAYRHGCELAVRALTLERASRWGVRWFRERQPWHSMAPIPADARLDGFGREEWGWRLVSGGSEARSSSGASVAPFEEALRQIAVAHEKSKSGMTRLISGPAASPESLGLERDVPGPHPELLQAIRWGGEGSTGWPRIEWPMWRTPTGAAWTFGEVRAGGGAGAGTPRVTELNWNSAQYEWGF
jgi:hypothetical protein